MQEQRFTRTLNLIQPPAENPTPEAALEWLREDLAPYLMVTFAGFMTKNEKRREACHVLGCDVMTLAEVAVEAVASGEPQAVEWNPENAWGRENHRAMLSGVIAAREAWEAASGIFDSAYEEMTGLLADLLEKDAERAAAMSRKAA